MSEKDKAPELFRELAERWQPGRLVGRAGGLAIGGVIAVSLREADLEPLLTYRITWERMVWTESIHGRFAPRKTPEALAAWNSLANAPQPGQIFRHYKGGLYSVVTPSLEAGSLTPLVTYISNAKGLCWTRTLENFTEDVPGPVSRFQRVYE